MIAEIANDIARLYGRNPQEALEWLGVQVIERPLAGRIKEIYFGDYVVVKSGIEPAYRNYYLAHALGHHVIHKHGNFLYCDSISHLTILKKEAEAEDFAACYLIPDEALLSSLLQCGEQTALLADALQVAPEPLLRRLQHIEGSGARAFFQKALDPDNP